MKNNQMKITILGTGTFYVSTERSGPAYLLEANGKKILIDCGPGTLLRLSQLGITPFDLDYIFLTHFHADHSGDLFSLQMNFRLNDFFTKRNIEGYPIIYGPPGVETFSKRLSEVYELPAFDNWSEIEYKPYEPEIKLGNTLVKPFRVAHTAFGKSATAYSLRFECGDKTIAFSGDSIKNTGLEKASKDADLFICDCSYTKGKASPAHLDTHEIGEVATKSNVKKVILTHFYPNLEEENLVSEVKEKFSGDVIRGEDLMKIEINSNH